MKHQKPFSLIALLTALSLWAVSNQAFSESLYINIDGQPMGLELTPRNIDGYGAAEIEAQNRFYAVELKDFPDSKGRAAYIDGQWQGLLMHNGQLHLLSNLVSSIDLNQRSSFVAHPLNQDMNLGQCGFTPNAPNQSMSTITPRSFSTSALQINFDTFCADEVDGVCLVGELTLVFDSQFESDFGSSYQAQAVAITEYVDLIYQAEFKIVFNKLRMTFGAGDQFGGDTDIEAVLEDMKNQRYDGETTSFDPNVFSILHFITGRNYSDVGEAIGIAYGPLYTNYPIPDDPLLCSGFAIGTSQVFGSGNNRTALTSLIVAHEIGHNFGFLHDGIDPGVTSCSATDFIMAARINQNATNFSTCSHEAIGPNLNAIASIERCFDFPINASLLKDSGNPATAEAGTIINTSYALSASARSDRTVNLRLTGDVTSSAATILDASVDGAPCTISNNSTRYTCNLANASTHNLDLQLQTALSDLNILHQVASTDANDYDVDSDDNQVLEVISVDFVESVGPAPETSESLTSKSSGGGAFSWWWSLNLILLSALRRRLA